MELCTEYAKMKMPHQMYVSNDTVRPKNPKRGDIVLDTSSVPRFLVYDGNAWIDDNVFSEREERINNGRHIMGTERMKIEAERARYISIHTDAVQGPLGLYMHAPNYQSDLNAISQKTKTLKTKIKRSIISTTILFLTGMAFLIIGGK